MRKEVNVKLESGFYTVLNTDNDLSRILRYQKSSWISSKDWHTDDWLLDVAASMNGGKND